MIEQSAADQWPTLRAEIRWIRTADNRLKAAAPGSIIYRQCVWLGPRDADPQTGLETGGGLKLAATCLFGNDSDGGQDVELSFWSSIALGSLAEAGTDLALVEGDHVVASGKIVGQGINRCGSEGGRRC